MLDRRIIETSVAAWLAEDVGMGDLTSELVIPAHATGHFQIEARVDLIVAGMEVALAVFRQAEPRAVIEVVARDGERVTRSATLARVTGPARGLLTAERTALNILQRMSGIATLTAEYVARISHTRARL
ncbi:MAG TPA: nicotinate-nucleotide diphosphorylase (carboxylating), partial [Hyphomicrobiaceae bacterium]|nr:nicotinate-nucleotide diphosphorylase (carboxylating) [Hyphomicrobiaceae bacterium]